MYVLLTIFRVSHSKTREWLRAILDAVPSNVELAHLAQEHLARIHQSQVLDQQLANLSRALRIMPRTCALLVQTLIQRSDVLFQLRQFAVSLT